MVTGLCTVYERMPNCDPDRHLKCRELFYNLPETRRIYHSLVSQYTI